MKSPEADLIESFLNRYFQDSEEIHPKLLKSVRYSLLQKAAKRFRSQLAFFVGQALGSDREKILPFAAALECVHAYSLIHDDLPCMDNDDIRRGEPTNHKVFGEAAALLAGDALLTEAFSIVSSSYAGTSELGLKLIAILSKAAGMRGMISGQMRDLESSAQKIQKIAELKLMHEQKTGALISAAVEAAALIGGANAQQVLELKLFGQNLGLAFQVKDDLLDFTEDKGISYTNFMGVPKSQEYLESLSETCFDNLKLWDKKADPLREIVQFNISRKN